VKKKKRRDRNFAIRFSPPSFTRRLSPFLLLLVGPVCARAQNTATETLQAIIAPEGGLFAITASVTFTKTGNIFNIYTSTAVTIQYRARTTDTTGSATITVKATSDFLPAGGPSVGSPPTAGDALTYICSGQTLGTCVNGTVSNTSATNVVTTPASSCTGGGGACSNADPNTVSVTFSLTNDPKYQTGSYSATVTWTISAS
jgi:hypothetical protein